MNIRPLFPSKTHQMVTIENIEHRKKHFGTIDHQPVYRYLLKAGFATYRVMNYGAKMTAIEVPDKKSHAHNIVAGFSTLGRLLAQKHLQFSNTKWLIQNWIGQVFVIILYRHTSIRTNTRWLS